MAKLPPKAGAAPVALLSLTGTTPPQPRLALPAALQAEAAPKPAVFDLQKAQHNLRKAFVPSRG